MYRGSARRAGGADTLSVVGVGDGGSPRYGGNELVEPVVGVGHHGGVVDVQLGQQVAVSVVGVAAGGDGAALVLAFHGQPVVGVVGVRGDKGDGSMSKRKTVPCVV